VKSYPQADGWSDDDRVLCKKCGNLESRIQRWNFTAEDFEKFRRINEKPAQWMFHEAEAKNGWVRVSFSQDFCTKTDTCAFRMCRTAATCLWIGMPQSLPSP